VSDNGPQYTSQEFANFAESYDFCHVTSSPLFPQSNGHAERAVQTTKKLLKESRDPYMALLTYRTTPLPWCNLTPAELLMGRKVRGNLPQVTEKLNPNWSYVEEFRKQDGDFKRKQKQDYDRRHRVQSLPPIPDESEVWITSGPQPVQGCATSTNAPRSYIVQTDSGEVHRKRSHLNVILDTPAISQSTKQIEQPRRIMTCSQTGTIIRPPNRL